MANNICRRCKRTVATPDFYTFEQMHYTCFHYEFEHDGDVDSDCNAGGCPSRVVRERVPANPEALEAGQLSFLGFTFIEERDGKAIVRLPNGSKTTVRFTTLQPEGGTSVHFTRSTWNDGETTRCLTCDWVADFGSRVAAETAAIAHQLRCPTVTT